MLAGLGCQMSTHPMHPHSKQAAPPTSSGPAWLSPGRRGLTAFRLVALTCVSRGMSASRDFSLRCQFLEMSSSMSVNNARCGLSVLDSPFVRARRRLLSTRHPLWTATTTKIEIPSARHSCFLHYNPEDTTTITPCRPRNRRPSRLASRPACVFVLPQPANGRKQSV
jgi:hypothetical protein